MRGASRCKIGARFFVAKPDFYEFRKNFKPIRMVKSKSMIAHFCPLPIEGIIYQFAAPADCHISDLVISSETPIDLHLDYGQASLTLPVEKFEHIQTGLDLQKSEVITIRTDTEDARM